MVSEDSARGLVCLPITFQSVRLHMPATFSKRLPRRAGFKQPRFHQAKDNDGDVPALLDISSDSSDDEDDAKRALKDTMSPYV